MNPYQECTKKCAQELRRRKRQEVRKRQVSWIMDARDEDNLTLSSMHVKLTVSASRAVTVLVTLRWVIAWISPLGTTEHMLSV